MAARLDSLVSWLAPPLAVQLIRFLNWRLQPEYLGLEPLRQMWRQGERVILSVWHDQLLLMPCGYHGPAVKALISPSRDGELIARTMARFGIGAVRGSSSRGGRAAFREMLDLARQDCDLALTPDGPRGPRHRVKEGVVQLARMTARPVVPMAFACSRGHRFASWARFLRPSPFGVAVFSFGPPLFVQAGEEKGAFQVRVQQAMEENTRRAFARLEEKGVAAV